MAYRGEDRIDWDVAAPTLRNYYERGATRRTTMSRLGISLDAYRKAIKRHCEGITPRHRWRSNEVGNILGGTVTEERFVAALATYGIDAEMAALIYAAERGEPVSEDGDERDEAIVLPDTEDAPAWSPPSQPKKFAAAFAAAEAAAGRPLSY